MKIEMLAATLLAVAVVAGAIFQAPPFRTVTDFNYRIKDYWDEWAADAPAPAPAPHAEELTLETLAANLRLPVEDVINRLNEEGITVKDRRQSLGQLADENGLTPRDVYAAIRRLFPEAQQQAHDLGRGRGQHRGQQVSHRGQGKGR